jgi:S-sulfosulfanyl-L-cysteine sulfohydrolase
MNRREFLHLLGTASAAGMALSVDPARAQAQADRLYDLPRFGQVSILHMTDTHAQLRPVHFREPGVNLGIGVMAGRPPHLVGKALLDRFGLAAGGIEAHAFTHLDFEAMARTYGRVGGFAHLATLIKRLRASRPGALLLDGGDTWHGSGPTMWSKGQDMVDAALMLGVDAMTLHFESTYGQDRVMEVRKGPFDGKVEIIAQNVRTVDFEDPVFEPSILREVNGVPVAVIGQAFPYTPIANPRWMVEEWAFGIREEAMQETVDAARAAGAKVVVLLSHNGMDVDLKMASRVRGIDAILGGHTHDGVPAPIVVENPGGRTLVTNGGSNGKFLGVLDFEVGSSGITGWRYKLLPVFANLLPADAEMAAYIEKVRAPHATVLGEKLAVTEGLLYRRGNFNGTFDQVICDALMAERDAEIAFSPGFRWGTTVLPGEAITMETLLDQTAITYPWVTLTEMTGEQIKTIMEDVCDNLFNPDPYYQQGGDMVRVGGMTYRCTPTAAMGSRISDMRVGGRAIEAGKRYKVVGWAPVSVEARDAGGEPVWEVVARHLRSVKTIKAVRPNQPEIVGMDGNPGLAP